MQKRFPAALDIGTDLNIQLTYWCYTMGTVKLKPQQEEIPRQAFNTPKTEPEPKPKPMPEKTNSEKPTPAENPKPIPEKPNTSAVAVFITEGEKTVREIFRLMQHIAKTSQKME